MTDDEVKEELRAAGIDMEPAKQRLRAMVQDAAREHWADEKARRVYYQSIVYHVCVELDRMLGLSGPRAVVCGTADNPTSGVQTALGCVQVELASLRARVKEFEGGDPVYYSGKKAIDAATRIAYLESEIHRLAAELEGYATYKTRTAEAESNRLQAEARAAEALAEKHAALQRAQEYIESANRAHDERDTLKAENVKLRHILSHVPSKVALKAKEEAGHGDAVAVKGGS